MKDHREIGKTQNLFMFSELSPGCPIWLPKGNHIYSLLSDKIRSLNLNNGYVEVRSPEIWKPKLYEISGHLEHFRKNMFEIGDEDYILKPMNCPGHMEIFRSQHWSYRDLPYRIHDQGVLHRNEASGALGGLTRTREFCQDDAHCFIPENMIEEEAQNLIALTQRVYAPFNMPLRAVLSTRPSKFMGETEQWDKAENALAGVLGSSSIDYEVAEGEGAFYGPKIDFMAKDSQDREWQTATIQLDFQLPQRFGLTYVNEQNSQSVPVVVHRAMYGSFERFIAILLEHFQGALPVWLAPIKSIVLPISNKFNEYAQHVATCCEAKLDSSDNTLSQKIAVAQEQQIPYMLIVGDRETKSRTVTIRHRDSNTPQEYRSLENVVDILVQEAKFDF